MVGDGANDAAALAAADVGFATGDALTVTSVTTPTDGTATIEPDNTVTYTPDADSNGTDSFDYTISDGNGGTATATVNVTIEAANDAPVAENDTASTTEDAAVNVDVLDNDSDVDDDPLNVSAVSNGANGTVANNNGYVTYQPIAGFTGSDSFGYTVADGNGGTAQATVNITVNPVNDAPVANDDPSSVNEGATVNIDLAANDSDADDASATCDLQPVPPLRTIHLCSSPKCPD